MRLVQLVMVIVVALCGVHCTTGNESEEGDSSRAGRASLPLTCAAGWDPNWAQASGANEWWVEYAITGGTVTSAHLEVVGVRNVPLAFRWNKWVSSTPRITRGTNVIVHATRQDGETARTEVFGYLAVTQPETKCTGTCVPNCTGRACGSDGCGGSCGSCPAGQSCEGGGCVTPPACEWDPTWAQASGANEWWIEYAIGGGTVTSAHLEVVGVRNVPLTFRWNKWVSSTSRITRGTNVIVHATRQGGATAETEAFGYLVDTRPETDCGPPACTPHCTNRVCGGDGCGGSCGTCPTATPYCLDGFTCSASRCGSSCPPGTGCFDCSDALACLPLDEEIPDWCSPT